MKLLLGLGIFGLLTSTIFTAIVFAGVRKFVANRRKRSPSEETGVCSSGNVAQASAWGRAGSGGASRHLFRAGLPGIRNSVLR